MNVATHQKKKNEITARKREKIQETDSRESDAVLLRSFRGQHGKQMIGCERCSGLLGLSGRPTAISTQLKRGRGPHHHIEAAVDWCSSQNFQYIYQTKNSCKIYRKSLRYTTSAIQEI